MVQRVYMPVFGSGLGHASRMLLIARSLEKDGIEVEFSSSFEAINYLKNNGFKCNSVPLVDVKWDEKGEVSILETLMKVLPALKNFAQQLTLEIDHMKSFSPNLVVADSRLSAVLAAKLLELPSLIILNQLRILLPGKEKRPKSFLEDVSAELLGKLWSFCDSIILPDLPPPYTISERNLFGVRSTEKKVRYVGFMVPRPAIPEGALEKIAKELNIDKGKPTVFAQISGPAMTKKWLIEALLGIASKYGEKYSLIVSEGSPGGNMEPIRFRGGWYYEWCPVKDELFALADVIITRGGHSTIAQSILFGKPMILIPIINHSEQMSNARKVSKLGIGVSMDERHLTPERLEESVYLMIENDYKRKAERLRVIAKNFDGVESTLNIAKAYL
ncbi:MAG: glycosyltransferase family protein [Nitrososphaerales archaeon]